MGALDPRRCSRLDRFERRHCQLDSQGVDARAIGSVDNHKWQAQRSLQLIGVDRETFGGGNVDLGDGNDNGQPEATNLLQQLQFDGELAGVENEADQIGPRLRVAQMVYGNLFVSALRPQRGDTG